MFKKWNMYNENITSNNIKIYDPVCLSEFIVFTTISNSNPSVS